MLNSTQPVRSFRPWATNVRSAGVALMAVVIALAIATVLAMTFLTQQTTSVAIASSLGDQAQARAAAESAMESAVRYVRLTDAWRDDMEHGVWVDEMAINGATVTVYGYDGEDTDGDGDIDTDGDLTDDPAQPITLVVHAELNGVRHEVRKTLTPRMVIPGGPIAYWPFEDEDGDPCLDESGNNRHGVYSGGVTLGEEGVIGNAVRFDGTTGLVDVSNMPRLSTAFTMTMWIKPDMDVDRYAAMLQYCGSSHGLIFQRQYHELAMYNQDNWRWMHRARFDMNPEEWQFIAVTWQLANDQLIYYNNGKPTAEFTGKEYYPIESIGGGSRVVMGNRLTNGQSTGPHTYYWYKGLMDEVRLYDRVLTSDEIAAMAEVLEAPAPDLHWPLDGNATESMSGIDGLATDVAWTADGVFGSAADFNGTTSNIQVAGNEAHEVTGSFSISCWARSDTDTWNSHGMLVSKRNQFILHPSMGQKYLNFYVHNGGWRSAHGNPTRSGDFDVTEWHHYGGVYNAESGLVHIYIDGVHAGYQTVDPTVLTSEDHPLTFGLDHVPTWSTQDRFFDGQMDDIRMWKEPLASLQMRDIFEAGRPSAESKSKPVVLYTFEQTEISPPGPAAHWTFDDAMPTERERMFYDESGIHPMLWIRGARHEDDPHDGIIAEYFDVGTRIYSMDDVDWDASPDYTEVIDVIDEDWGAGAGWPGGPTDGWAVRYRFYSSFDSTASMRFRMEGEDGYEMYINGRLMMSRDWSGTWRELALWFYPFTDEVIEFEVLFYNDLGDASLRLEYELPPLSRYGEYDLMPAEEFIDHPPYGDPIEFGVPGRGDGGTAIRLNGVDNYIAGDMDTSAHDFAVSMWFKTTDDNGGLFSTTNTAYHHWGDRAIGIYNGRLYRYIYPFELRYVTANVADDQWHHIVFTHSAELGGSFLYLDGVLIDEGWAWYSRLEDYNQIVVGRSRWWQHCLEGDIDDLKIYREGLTAEQVLDLYNDDPIRSVLSPTLVADSSNAGSPVHMVLNDPDEVDWLADGLEITGPVWMGSSLPGSKVRHAAATSDACTIEAVVTLADDSQTGRIFSFSEPGTGDNFALMQTGTGLAGRLATSRTGLYGTPQIEIDGVLTLGETHHIMMSYDLKRVVLYVDGIEVASKIRSGSVTWEDDFRFFAAGEEDEAQWEGTLHRLAVYDYAVNSLQAENLSNGLPAGDSDPPAAYLDYDEVWIERFD